MRLVTFKVAYLPDSASITTATTCTINMERIGLILPLKGDISGANTSITIDGREIHVPETHEEVVAMLNSPVSTVDKSIGKKRNTAA